VSRDGNAGVSTFERFRGGPWGQNCFLVVQESDAILVDPGGNAAAMLERVRADRLTIQAIVNTHGHFDHIGGVQEIMDATGASFYISPLEKAIMKTSNMLRFIFKSPDKFKIPQATVDLAGASIRLKFGSIELSCLHTPGHTPGGYCFIVEGHIFTGDTVLTEMPGSAELPGGNADHLIESLEMLALLDPTLIVHPGHGYDTNLGTALASIKSCQLPGGRGR
jgi:hydroxyacylglutathione hydrolase